MLNSRMALSNPPLALLWLSGVNGAQWEKIQFPIWIITYTHNANDQWERTQCIMGWLCQPCLWCESIMISKKTNRKHGSLSVSVCVFVPKEKKINTVAWLKSQYRSHHDNVYNSSVFVTNKRGLLLLWKLKLIYRCQSYWSKNFSFYEFSNFSIFLISAGEMSTVLPKDGPSLGVLLTMVERAVKMIQINFKPKQHYGIYIPFPAE